VTVKAQEQFKGLEKYGVLEYTLAEMVRYGDTLAEYPEKLHEMPYPKDLEALNNKNPDAGVLAAYDDALTKELAPYLDKAKSQWQDATDTAKKAGVSNQWSQRALEDLNREFPDEYDVLHQELFEGTDKP